jgi:hypothetical protein
MVSSINKTDHHDITEILFKVALTAIKQTNIYFKSMIPVVFCRLRKTRLFLLYFKSMILVFFCRLGKTIQIISFLSGLFDMDKVHAAIIVMPVSLIINWEKEFQKW